MRQQHLILSAGMGDAILLDKLHMFENTDSVETTSRGVQSHTTKQDGLSKTRSRCGSKCWKTNEAFIRKRNAHCRAKKMIDGYEDELQLGKEIWDHTSNKLPSS